MCTIFSASIAESAGFEPNEAIANLQGWTVDRQNQSAFYKIIHNLNLSHPEQLKIFVHSEYQPPFETQPTVIYNKAVEVFSQDANSFLVRTTERNSIRQDTYEQAGPFGFVAVLMD